MGPPRHTSPAREPDPLPFGWKMAASVTTGDPYYVNAVTGERTAQRPRLSAGERLEQLQEEQTGLLQTLSERPDDVRRCLAPPRLISFPCRAPPAAAATAAAVVAASPAAICVVNPCTPVPCGTSYTVSRACARWITPWASCCWCPARTSLPCALPVNQRFLSVQCRRQARRRPGLRQRHRCRPSPSPSPSPSNDTCTGCRRRGCSDSDSYKSQRDKSLSPVQCHPPSGSSLRFEKRRRHASSR